MIRLDYKNLSSGTITALMKGEKQSVLVFHFKTIDVSFELCGRLLWKSGRFFVSAPLA